MKLKLVLSVLMLSMVSPLLSEVKDNRITEEIENAFIPLDVPMDLEMQRDVEKIATRNGVEFTLAMAIIYHESNFTEKIISKSNDWGYMQINVCNHAWLSKELDIHDFLDGRQNVEAGTYIIGQFLDKYKDYHVALTCYNRGEGGAKALFNKGIYYSDYSSMIINTKQKYDLEINTKMLEIERQVEEMLEKKRKEERNREEMEVTETICTLPDIEKWTMEWRMSDKTWGNLVEDLKGDRDELLHFGFTLVPQTDNEIWEKFRWETIRESGRNAQLFEKEVE